MGHAKLKTPDDGKYFAQKVMKGMYIPHEHGALEAYRADHMELGEIVSLKDEKFINNGTALQPLRGRDLAHSLQTVGGKFIWPLDPYADEVDYLSVAHGLSTECRFGNQSPFPMSVAWHCVALSHVVPPEFAQAALVHDAAEAYLKDIPRPIRRQEPFKSGYTPIEENLLEVCCEHFGVDYGLIDNEEFLSYDIKFSVCEMKMLAEHMPVFRAKLNVLLKSNPSLIEDSLDENYIKWVEMYPRHNEWQTAKQAWIDRYNELF